VRKHARAGARAWLIAALCSAWCSCAAHVQVPSTPLYVPGEHARPFTLAGVGGCDDAPARGIEVQPDRPLVLLVHGMHSRRHRFVALAASFHDAGQQALCFRYDGRRSISRTAGDLHEAIARLAHVLTTPEIVVLGHSQGGLVARAALTTSMTSPLPRANYRLVTVSTPFAGIRIARSCGSIPYHIASFGVSYAVCRAISGESWNETHPRASMVLEPAPLDPSVSEHLAILTDERDSCRRFSADGLHCLQNDHVFSLAEQHSALLARDSRVHEAAVQAGHVEVVGGLGLPRKLIEALKQHGLLANDLGEHAVFEEQTVRSSL
jgi:pimeloyl-ACP methyl ester carboxylesterase